VGWQARHSEESLFLLASEGKGRGAETRLPGFGDNERIENSESNVVK